MTAIVVLSTVFGGGGTLSADPAPTTGCPAMPRSEDLDYEDGPGQRVSTGAAWNLTLDPVTRTGLVAAACLKGSRAAVDAAGGEIHYGGVFG